MKFHFPIITTEETHTSGFAISFVKEPIPDSQMVTGKDYVCIEATDYTHAKEKLSRHEFVGLTVVKAFWVKIPRFIPKVRASIARTFLFAFSALLW